MCFCRRWNILDLGCRVQEDPVLQLDQKVALAVQPGIELDESFDSNLNALYLALIVDDLSVQLAVFSQDIDVTG